MADKYAFMVKSIDISKVGNVAAEEGNAELTRLLGAVAIQVSQALPSLDDGNFQIVSHDMAISGTTMTITFLLRHSANQPKARKRH